MGNWSKDAKDRVQVGRGTLRKLLPSGVWHFHFRNDDGEWTTRSTRHRDKGGAIKWAEAFSTRLTQDEFGIAVPAKPSKDDQIEPALTEWLTYQKAQNKPSTHRTYSSIGSKFRRFLKTKPGLKRLREITIETILAFRQWAVDAGNTKVTVDNNLIALRSFFNWCRSLNKMAVNPASQQRHGTRIYFDAESPRKDTYTEAQYHRIIEAAGDMDRLVFRFLANTGLRSSELAMLEWDDVDTGANLIHIRRKITHDGEDYSPKDDTDRAVPINQVVYSALNAFQDGNDRAGYIVQLPAVKSRTDYFERSYLERLKKLSGKTRIAETKLTLHNFRRFFVSQCADCGIPMAIVMDWVGHDEIRMVMHYYRLRDESAQKAMTKFRADGHMTGRASTDPNAGTDGREEGSRSEKSDGRRKKHPRRRCGATDRHRTTPDDLEHLGSAGRKTASPQRKRG